MNLVEKYIFKQLFFNSLLILLLIISVFSLSKSVQLIELIINRGLPSFFFLKLIMLSLPQIIPVLLPIIICLSIFFVFSRMQTDRELIVLQSSGLSVLDLAKPVLIFSLLLSSLSFYFTLHLAPKSNENFKILLYTIKNDYSSTLLQEGIFNTIGKDFTIFIKERMSNGYLNNIFIHDSREIDSPSTLIAQKGKLINDGLSTKILLEDGSQQFQSKEKKLSVLYFDKYLLDINKSDSQSMLDRWKSPAERSLYELRNPNPNSGDDINNLQAFRAEITHRFSVPLNTLGFSLVVLTFMLSMRFFRVENYGHTVRVFILILCLEVISIMAANLSIKYENMQIINFLPFILSIFLSFYFFEITRKIKS
tara:strand:- start:2512 stop:3606 length:1095 start_codon:yes stop_codon:yes gene_type:complete